MEIDKFLKVCRVDGKQKIDTSTDGYWTLKELLIHFVELKDK